MLSSTKIESLAVRFEPYIDELRDFFGSRNVAFGAPEDLRPFLGRLGDPAFQEEVVSMVRSILYREGESLPRTELMEVLALAVGGMQVEDHAADLHEPMRELLAFVTFVSRSQREAYSAPAPTEEGAEEIAGTEQPEAGEAVPATFPQITEVAVPATLAAHTVAAPAPDVAPEAEAATSRFTNDKLSQTLLHLETQAVATDPLPVSSPIREQPATDASFAPMPAVQVGAEPSRFVSLIRRAYWIPGLLALVLAVVAGVLIKNRNEPQQAAAVPAPNPTIAASPTPKPSAYGTVLGGKTAKGTDLSLPGPTTEGSGPAKAADIDTPTSRESGANVLAARHASPTTARAEAYGLPHADASAIKPLATHGAMDPREGVFLASSGAMASHLVYAPAPGYPKLASFTHTEGQVIVQVVVGRDGRVAATRVLDGPRLLRGAAEHTIRRWRYRPYVVDGHTTDVATIVTVNFRLRK